MHQNAKRIARICVMLVGLLWIAGLTNAQPDPFTPGVDAGIQAASVWATSINGTGSSIYDDVNVTVEWAYADGHRIAFGWKVEFNSLLLVGNPAITLIGEDGQRFPIAPDIFNRGGLAGGWLDRAFFSRVSSFDASSITGEPESLALTVVFTFEGASETAAQQSGEIKAFTTSIDFEVPFIPAQQLESEYRAEVNGLTLSLSDISYAPSESIARLCYPVAEESAPLMPHISRKVYIDHLGYFVPDKTPREDRQTCGKLVILIPADEKTGRLTLTIERLQSHVIITEERVARLQELVSEAGLPLEVMTETLSEGVLRYFLNPTGEIKDRDAVMLAFEALETQAMRETVEGPWIFEIDLRE